MNKQINSHSFEEIQLICKRVLDQYVEFCFLLGSAATTRFNQESDIDLAVFWKPTVFNPSTNDVDFAFKVKIIGELEDEFHRDVDLVSLNNVDVIYGIQVVDTGRLVIGNNPGILLEWKAKQLSRYPDFKASRAIIEKNILNRKKYV